jgi:hypothetical protein
VTKIAPQGQTRNESRHRREIGLAHMGGQNEFRANTEKAQKERRKKQRTA